MAMASSWRATIAAGLLLAATPVTAQPAPAYVLGPDDQIEIVVFGRPEMSVKTRIRADGSITLPVIGPVKAAGRSAGELSDAIAGQLRSEGVLQKPVVNVEVAAFLSRTVTVLGALGTPGVYGLDKPYRLSSLIARAGGVRADGSDHLTLRRAGNGPVRSIEIASLATDAKADVLLEPDDLIYVPPAELFFVYGQVSAPGAYQLTSGMTLRQALARGGGPTLAGTEKRIILYRQGHETSQADLAAPVAKGDVLFVRERTF